MGKTCSAKSPNLLATSFSRRMRRFYNEFSEFVLHELSKPDIRRFVGAVIEAQGIESSEVEVITVMVYPFGTSEDERVYARNEKINIMRAQYFGHYIPWLRRIEIYPPRLPPEITEGMTARQIWNNKNMRFYFYRYEPLETLIHEYLHTKCKSERTVKKLSRNYMVEFEEETWGEIRYSDKMPFSVWLDLFLMACKHEAF